MTTIVVAIFAIAGPLMAASQKSAAEPYTKCLLYFTFGEQGKSKSMISF